MKRIKVLLVEDDPMVREVNRQFIERVEGFEVIGMAGNGRLGIELVKDLKPDLVFMDIFMPEQDGIETLRQIREAHLAVDVISVTAANEMKTIQKVLHLGVFDYIMKPFTFERMEQTLQNYRRVKLQMEEATDVTQQQLDRMMMRMKEPVEPQDKKETPDDLPKGFNGTTLKKVMSFLQERQAGASADEVAAAIGVARVTARRYLDYMEKQKMIKVDIQYGNVGRPVNQYYV